MTDIRIIPSSGKIDYMAVLEGLLDSCYSKEVLTSSGIQHVIIPELQLDGDNDPKKDWKQYELRRRINVTIERLHALRRLSGLVDFKTFVDMQFVLVKQIDGVQIHADIQANKSQSEVAWLSGFRQGMLFAFEPVHRVEELIARAEKDLADLTSPVTANEFIVSPETHEVDNA